MFKLSNPYFFWTVVVLLLLSITIVNYPPDLDIKKTTVQQQKDIVEQSYNQNKQDNTYILDLDKIDNATNLDDVIVDENYKDRSFISKVKNVSSSDNILLILYTIVISILFIYREKQNRTRVFVDEKIKDKLRMASAKKDTRIDPDLKSGLSTYSNILSPDILLNTLDQKIQNEAKYIIIASRVVLEKLILELYSDNFEDEVILNTMIFKLQKAKLINTSMLNYAHIIKAFGNKAVHPNIQKPITFSKQEAQLVLSTLLQFLKECDENNILDIKNA